MEVFDLDWVTVGSYRAAWGLALLVEFIELFFCILSSGITI
jgi:hypothetical protein